MNYLLLALVISSVALTQMLAGGRSLALCLPGYGLLALAAILSWWPRRREPIRLPAGECLGAAALFVLYIAGRALFSPEPYLARHDLFAALGAAALYLLVALSLSSSNLRLLLVAALLLLGVANCAIGAVQFFKGQDFMLFSFLPRANYGWRASGFYGYPNHLAGFLEIALMMGLSTAFWSRWPSWAKMLTGYVCLVFLLTILATGSRGGYISVTVGLMVFGLLSLVLVGKLASGRALGMILAGILLIGGVGFGVKQVMSKSFLIQSRANETLTVDASRMRLWQAAWKQFRLQPIVGTGSGTYLYYGRQFRSRAIQPDPIHAHNDYFELLAEYGILGIIAAVIFLETHLRHGWVSFIRRLSRTEDISSIGSNSLALTVGAFSAAAACLTQSLFDFNLHIPANVLVAALVFGLLANPEAPRKEQDEPVLPAFLRLVLPAVGLWIALVALPTFPPEYITERARWIMTDASYMTSPERTAELEGLVRQGLSWDGRNPELHIALANVFDAKTFQATDPAPQKEFQSQALEEYRHAVELAPRDVRLVLDLGWALDAAKEFGESDPVFQRALDLDPNSSHVQYSYASHLEAVGKLADAIEHYRLSLRLQNNVPAATALERLSSAPPGTPSSPPAESAPPAR